MADQFEKFIRDNRHAFDDKEPSERVWKGIYEQVGSRRRSWGWLWKAASLVLLLTTSYLAVELYSAKSGVIASGPDKLTEEFHAVENFYFQKISEQKKLIYNLEEQKLVTDEVLEQDLHKLDAMYEVLKEELRENPSKKVVDALILNLLIRVDMLSKELQELEEYPEPQERGKAEVNI